MVGKDQQLHQETADIKLDSEQPEGWALPKISDILTVNYGKGLRKSDRKKGIVPVYGSNGVVGRHNRALTEGPTIILGRKGTVGAVNFSTVGCWPIDTTYFIDEFHELVPQFIFHAMRSLNLADLDTSTAIPGLNRNDIYKQQIPLPPIPEQKRIVVKVEELLGRVNVVHERLAKVKQILKRFRQSVLAAACSGTLTAGWRAIRPNVQKTAELVEEVQLWEKRRYTEECEKAKRNGKGKPRRPSILDLKELDSHPEIKSWATLKMDYAFRPDGLFDGPFGSNLKTGDYTQGGVRVIRIENIGFLSFLEEKRTYISAQKYETLKKHTVGEGDLIFASFISERARVVVLPKIAKSIAKADCFCLRPLPQLLDTPYLAIILSSSQTYSKLIEGIHGATRPRITTKQLKNLNIPLAPLGEQKEIVRRVEALFNLADAIEKRVAAAGETAERLRQAILTKAFRGELVPIEAEMAHREGRSYEPGSALFTKIRDERKGTKPQEKFKRS